MNLLSRIIRIFRADMHGVLDHLEDKELLLKQSLREMEEALGVEAAQVSKLAGALAQVREGRQKADTECRKLEADVDAALVKDREDLARQLLRRQKEKEGLRDELKRQADILESDYDQARREYETRKDQYQSLQARSVRFLAQRPRSRLGTDWSGDDFHSSSTGRMEAELELELIRRKEGLTRAITEVTS